MAFGTAIIHLGNFRQLRRGGACASGMIGDAVRSKAERRMKTPPQRRAAWRERVTTGPTSRLGLGTGAEHCCVSYVNLPGCTHNEYAGTVSHHLIQVQEFLPTKLPDSVGRRRVLKLEQLAG
jgi:hypothetical protein